MIKIRLQRHGARHSPFYRMVVTPSTSRRDGKFIEVLGTYNPQAHARTEELKLKMDRIDHWLGEGAQPTDTARSLIQQSRLTPEEWLQRAEKKSQSKTSRKQASSAPSMDESVSEEAEVKKPAEETKSEEPAEETKSEEPAEETKSEELAEEAKSEEPKSEEPESKAAEGESK